MIMKYKLGTIFSWKTEVKVKNYLYSMNITSSVLAIISSKMQLHLVITLS